jgi:hypothetical protein
VVQIVWFGKTKLVGESVTFGPETNPVPVRLIVCGLPGALSVTVIVPVLVPDCVGVKVTLIVQVAPTPTEPPQVFVCAKSPLATMAVILSSALPVLVKITLCEPLVIETNCAAKLRLGGESATTGIGTCSRMETVLSPGFAAAWSSLPSPLKSPTATELG